MRLFVPFRDWRLGTRLALMVLALMAGSIVIMAFTYSHYEEILLEQMQYQTEALSKSLEIGVQHLTSTGQSDQQFLEDYVKRLAEKGVTEVTVLSSERTVVASSDAAKLGKRVQMRGAKDAPQPLVISGTIGEAEARKKKIAYNLEIPIIVDDQKEGYLRLKVVLDDFADFMRRIYIRRTLLMGLVFLAGAGIALLLGWRMTAPLGRLADAAERVGEGDLDAMVNERTGGEIGRVQRRFNEMVSRLREKRVLEAKLRRAERAGSIGRLASAVAHEIRNPLNYINLSVDHLRAAHRPPSAEAAREFDESIAQVKAELQRVNTLVSDFLNFGRPPRLKLARCRVDEILTDVVRFVTPRAAAQAVSIELSVDPALPVVRADCEAIRTCVLNLVTNALQAMGQSGSLRVSAGAGPEGWIEVRVVDSGPGIPEKNLERIFEPYFSTKDAGVGLGLAITQRLVQEHGGELRVESRPGTTEFRLELPVDGPVDLEPATPPLSAEGTAG